MQELLEYISKKLEKLNNESILNEEQVEKLNSYIEKLNSMKETHINIDESILDSIFDDEVKNSRDYKILIKLKDYFEINKEESQIKQSKEYLDRIVTIKINEFLNKKDSLTDKILSNKEEVLKVCLIKDILINYNDSTYIDQEKLDLINSLVEEIDISEEIVKLYLLIARNNSKIEKQSLTITQTHELTIDEIDEIDEERDNILQEEESLEYNNTIQNYTNKYLAYKNNLSYKELNPNIYEISSEIMKDFLIELNDVDEETLQVALFAEDDIDIIKSLTEESLKLGVSIALLNAYENLDINSIVKIIDSYRKNIYIDIPTFLTLNGHDEYAKKIKEYDYLANLIVSEEQENRYESYKDITFDKLEKFLEYSNITKSDYIKYKMKKVYDDLIYLFKDRIINDDVLELVNGQLKKLEILNERLKIETTGPKTNPDELFTGKFSNYIVFIDPDLFIKTAQEIKLQHADAIDSSFLSTFDKIINTDYTDLQTGNKRIKGNRSKKKQNKVKEEKSAHIRVGFKILRGAEVDGHKVFVIYLPCYGDLDGISKEKGLKSSDELYSSTRGKEIYANLQKLFSSKNETLSEEAQKQIDKTKEIYKLFSVTDEKKLTPGGEQ